MVAVVGATVEQAAASCEAAPDACWVANDNAPGQVVIAGTPDGVERGATRAKELGVKRATPLNVGGAFHTPLMRTASEALADELAAVTFTPSGTPVVANLDARPYDDGPAWRERPWRAAPGPGRARATRPT